jgi:cytochrome b561
MASLGASSPPHLSQRRYSGAAILLHWILALALAGQVWLGWYEQALPDHTPAQYVVLDVHTSVGITILILSLARLALRLSRPPPALPMEMPAWERILARTTHLLFYIFMIGVPLTGWVLASMGRRPIDFWNAFDWPHLPIAGMIPHDQRRPIHEITETIHGSILVWTGIGLVVLHVLGALRHQFDRTPVLWKMIPLLKPPAV